MKDKVNETAQLTDSVNAHPNRIWVAWNHGGGQPFRVLGNSPREAYDRAGVDHGRVVITEYHLARAYEARRDFVLVPAGSEGTKSSR